MDDARANGVSKTYASSGCAAFERPFALWCEAEAMELDYPTQHDLHANLAALLGYDRALIVGHNEYWAWEMRDALEAWVEAGGQLCIFAGNLYWQTRPCADRPRQTCYKTWVGDEDPMRDSDPQRLTDHGDHHRTRRPATLTMGLTGSAGVHAGWSRCPA